MAGVSGLTWAAQGCSKDYFETVDSAMPSQLLMPSAESPATNTSVRPMHEAIHKRCTCPVSVRCNIPLLACYRCGTHACCTYHRSGTHTCCTHYICGTHTCCTPWQCTLAQWAASLRRLCVLPTPTSRGKGTVPDHSEEQGFAHVIHKL